MPRQSLKRRPDGRYRCKYKDVYFYGSTQLEALEKREEYKKQEFLGVATNSDGIRFLQYASTWVTAYKSHLTPRPYNAIVFVLEKFGEMYGDKPIKDITATDIKLFFDKYDGMSKSSINKARDAVFGVFKSALADRVILANPCTYISLPKGTKGTHRAITQKERELIHKTKHERMRPAVMAMLYAGLRRGEALAIDIDRDIDFEKKTINVREAVRFDLRGMPVIVNPKTDAGERTIPLLDILADELKGLHGLLLSRSSGGHMSESSFARAWESYITALETELNGDHKRWYGKRKAAGNNTEWKTVNIRPHDLRHSFCTMLYDNNVDIKTAMKWMGHADQTMTLRIYTHLSEERENDALLSLANGLNQALRGQSGGQEADRDIKRIDT